MAEVRLAYGIVHRKETFLIKLDSWSDCFFMLISRSHPSVFLFSSALSISPLVLSSFPPLFFESACFPRALLPFPSFLVAPSVFPPSTGRTGLQPIGTKGSICLPLPSTPMREHDISGQIAPVTHAVGPTGRHWAL